MSKLSRPDAQWALGYLYDTGDGVEQDYLKAYEWYSKAAEQGDYLAQYYIGVLYYDGIGLEQDNAQAQNNIGVLYAEGCGVEKDMDKAKEWFTKAAEQGSENAQENLKSFN